MKVEIDLNALLKEAVPHMENEDDLHFSIGMGLQDLYWDVWVEKLQNQMIKEFLVPKTQRNSVIGINKDKQAKNRAKCGSADM